MTFARPAEGETRQERQSTAQLRDHRQGGAIAQRNDRRRVAAGLRGHLLRIDRPRLTSTILIRR